MLGNSAVSVDYVANASRDQLGVIDINEPVNRVRPGVNVFDPTGDADPGRRRAARRFRACSRCRPTRCSTATTSRCSSRSTSGCRNRWSGRVAYTLQQSHYVGIGNPDARRVWLDNDAGRRLRPLRLRPAARAGGERHLEPVALAEHRHGGQRDLRRARSTRPSAATSTATATTTTGRSAASTTCASRSGPSSIRQGRAVINGLTGPESFLIDMSFRYSIPLKAGLDSLDLFYDIFNVFNRENLVAPTGNRAVVDLHDSDGGAVPAADAVRHPRAFLRGRMRDFGWRCWSDAARSKDQWFGSQGVCRFGVPSSCWRSWGRRSAPLPSPPARWNWPSYRGR